MHKTITWSAAALFAAVGMAAATAVFAQGNTAFVKERQGFMDQQQKDVNAIGAYGKGQGDQATALEKANDLVALTPKLIGYFDGKQNTGSDSMPGVSYAKPEIWQSFDKFKATVPVLQTEEAKLVAAVKSGDPQATADQLARMYKNGCGACHTDYRAPKT